METIQKPNICVVHLVWVPLGTAPLKDFLSSYEQYRSGLAHDLVVIFSGFEREQELEHLRELLSSYRYFPIYVRKPGLDITSYFKAVRAFDYDYYCFLNSYSRFLDHEWLSKLFYHLGNGVGLVGATGSYESMYTVFMEGREPIRGKRLLTRIRMRLNQNIKMMKKRLRFPPFPNYHVRTNGFMASREVLQKIRTGSIRRKTHAYKFESGKNSLTRQVLRMGLRALVVGKDGKGYEMEQWCRSGTFRQGEQENLLIADNQTDMYSLADGKTKRLLSWRSWGAGAAGSNLEKSEW